MTSPAIIGGTPDDGDAAVVLVEIAGGVCTGTLIAPTVVLTAAHCVVPADDAEELGTVSVGSGDGAFAEVVDIAELIAHPLYVEQVQADLGLLRLAGPLAPEPLAYRRAPLPVLIGEDVRVIGYGLTSFADPASIGRKHQATLEVRAQDGEYLIAGDAAANTCQGDSGGPALLDLGDGEQLVAVDSFGEVGCAGNARLGRVDPYVAWIDEVAGGWSCADDAAACPAPSGCCAAGPSSGVGAMLLVAAVALAVRRYGRR